MATKGSLKRLASCGIGRKIYVHINNTNPVLIEDSPQRAEAARAGWDIAYDGMEISPMSVDAQPLTSDELEARLRQIGAERYHNLHRFHRRLHSGQCTYEEVQAWALNRYYYQAMIPIKDATILTRMTRSRGPPAMAQAHRGSRRPA